jgi:hypothetical protein
MKICKVVWFEDANLLLYEGVPKNFRTGRLERELQMVQLSTTRWGCIAILWVSLVSFAAITLCVASQRVFVVDFVIDSVRKLLDTPSYSTYTLYLNTSNTINHFSVRMHSFRAHFWTVWNRIRMWFTGRRACENERAWKSDTLGTCNACPQEFTEGKMTCHV